MRENDFEAAFEQENLSEPFLGPMLGEGEDEGQFEQYGEGFGDPEGFGESAFESGDRFLGQLLGEGENDFEGFGEGEQFFGKLIKKALPVLKKVAKVAAPIIGTAVAGPIGGKIGSLAGNLLGEGENDFEFELEYETESESEFQAVMQGPLTEQQALGELMATAAANAATDMEAEAQIGAATIIALTPHDRQALRHVLANLNRGTAVLTRILRRNRSTAPFVRTVPTIVKRTAVSLQKQAAAGRPITKQVAAKTMAKQTKKVLASPAVCSHAVARNVRATKAVSNRINKVHREMFD